MREMKDSGIEWIGEIPKHWKLERLQWHISEIKECEVLHRFNGKCRLHKELL